MSDSARPPVDDPVATATGWTFAPVPHAVAVTDRGATRDRNEDTFFLSADGRLLVVADGLGGHSAGEVASVLTAHTVAAFTEDALARIGDPSPEIVREVLASALREAHQRVLAIARNERGRRGMGATVVVALVGAGWVCTAHAGDARAYLVRRRDAVQLTRDHSTVSMMVESGILDARAARHHPRRNEVLQAIGNLLDQQPSTAVGRLEAGDVVLLCSDGLWEPVADDEIADVLGNRDVPLAERARELVARANRAGGPDNITVALYEVPEVAASSR